MRKIIATYLKSLFFFLRQGWVLINPDPWPGCTDIVRTSSLFSHRWIFHCSHFCLNDALLPQSSWSREGFPLNQPVEAQRYWAAPLTLKRMVSYLMNRSLQSLTSRMVGFPSTATLFFPLPWFCVGLLVEQKSGWKSTASESNQIFSNFLPKTAVFFLLQHTGADIYQRWDFTRKGQAAPCLCITQEINESSSCRETSLFEVQMFQRKAVFEKKS